MHAGHHLLALPLEHDPIPRIERRIGRERHLVRLLHRHGRQRRRVQVVLFLGVLGLLLEILTGRLHNRHTNQRQRARPLQRLRLSHHQLGTVHRLILGGRQPHLLHASGKAYAKALGVPGSKNLLLRNRERTRVVRKFRH